MDPQQRGPAPLRQTNSPVNAVITAVVFGTLTALVEPPWSYIDNTTSGHLFLTLAHLFPLLVLSLLARPGSLRQWVACGVAALGSIGLGLHAGLSASIVENIDAGGVFSNATALAILEILLSTVSIPFGLLLVCRRRSPGLAIHLAVPMTTAAVSQILWFGLARIVQGASGIEYWFATRIIIHLATGMTAGFLWAGARIFRPVTYPSHWGGFAEHLFSRLPSALPLSLLLSVALLASGAMRISAELSDTSRLITLRIDDYFLSLTNLRRAQDDDLVYPELYTDLAHTRDAVLGAAAFDPELAARTREMLQQIETPPAGAEAFRDAVLSVNRRLLAAGEPFFLEPHTMGKDEKLWKFLFRYRIERRGRYEQSGGRSIPMLRLRRLDDILIDTPYTGLSYRNLGTVLMDHIDDTTLRSHAQLFKDSALKKDPEEGRFAVTALEMRRDRRGAIEAAIAEALPAGGLQRLAAFSDRWRTLADLSRIRARMDLETLAAYDALTEAIARQTEVHEARHGLDGPLPKTLTELDELSAGPLAAAAVSEIRAYLTEIIDGPLGPKFSLSTLGEMIIGPNARANAYFFAAMVIIEGLWGEKVRRPDIVEKEGEDGARSVVMPISPDHPGWLSYSRIYGAYATLSGLDPDELRTRAVTLFERLFDEEYRHIRRRR